ncbi:MAG: hypothetical protein SV775_17605 [Thermodesulfobacteriota bacterium]|nr:hypothetical protein [Thermodesulfobacteriota bacterium]
MKKPDCYSGLITLGVMGSFEIFVIRFVLSVMFAFFVSRFFFQDMAVIKVFGLAVVMLGLAYVSEYFRKRNRGGRPED